MKSTLLKSMTLAVAMLFVSAANLFADSETITISFNDSTYAMSGSAGNDGDITEAFVIYTGELTTTISPSTGKNPNRFWNTKGKPQLRVYDGTVTFEVPEGRAIKSIEFTVDASKFAGFTGNPTDFTMSDGATSASGNSEMVILTCSKQNRINAVTITVDDADENTTTKAYVGISEIRTPAANGEIFTISGMKVSDKTALPKGIYIVDGKKVIKK